MPGGRSSFTACRPPAFASAYLAKRLGISGMDALERVRKVLPRAMPKEPFMAALDRVDTRA